MFKCFTVSSWGARVERICESWCGEEWRAFANLSWLQRAGNVWWEVANGTLGVIATQQSQTLSTALCNHTSVKLRTHSSKNTKLSFVVSPDVMKHGSALIAERMSWRLKTEDCTIRWLCKVSAGSSESHFDWTKTRTDDRAEQQIVGETSSKEEVLKNNSEDIYIYIMFLNNLCKSWNN